MEESQMPSRERSRAPSSRVPSRISTTHGNSRLGTQSANSSASNISTSPQLRAAHPSHRYHHAGCANPTIPRSPPKGSARAAKQPSREGSSESVRQTPVSAFLLEKLQKERLAETQKTASPSPTLSRTNSDMTGSVDLRSSNQRSPGKTRELDATRVTDIQQPDKKGMGLKEMEQVVSGLHKQNFDLKLELYHRRDRQSRLEERLETLEAEKAEVENINDRLVEELEKRDKAVEEAVAMIVTLEAKIESLVQNQSMVRQIEEDGYSLPLEYDAEISAPRSNALDVLKQEHDEAALSRMPSFLSERTENTENLRSVYLGTRGSVLSLSRVTGSLYDADNVAVNSLVSPSFSVLSESSFVSVYGRKDKDGGEEELPAEGEPARGHPMVDGESGKADDATPRKSRKHDGGANTPMSASFTRSNSSGQFQPIANVTNGSPLQQIERLDPAYAQRRETPRPMSSGRDAGYGGSSTASRSPSHIRTKQEKREALRRVMTDGAGGVSLHDHVLPPTPDTTSSSMLRRYKHSNDALPRRQEASNDGRSQGSWSDVGSSKDRLMEPSAGVPLEPKGKAPAALPLDKLDALVGRENPISLAAQILRPRSADETTVSHRRANSWDLDSEVSEADSFQSDLDVWLRMAGKPQRERRGGRASPDLFGIPTQVTGGAWTMNAMFGANGGYNADANMGQCSDKMDDLVSAQRALFGPCSPPPPPNRQSSLNAQTRSGTVSAGPAPQSRNLQAPQPVSRRPRFPRRNSDDARMRAGMKTPTPADFTQPPPADQKRGHYPPVAGQQGHHRNSIVRLFRRSIGGNASPAPALEEPPPNTAEPAGQADAAKSASQGGGVPVWAQRSSAFDEDRSGATPPPIQRDPRGRRGSAHEAEAHGHVAYNMDREPSALASSGNAEDQGVSTAQQQQWGGGSPTTASSTAGRKRWLPTFGRSNSLKNKGG